MGKGACVGVMICHGMSVFCMDGYTKILIRWRRSFSLGERLLSDILSTLVVLSKNSEYPLAYLEQDCSANFCHHIHSAWWACIRHVWFRHRIQLRRKRDSNQQIRIVAIVIIVSYSCYEVVEMSLHGQPYSSLAVCQTRPCAALQTQPCDVTQLTARHTFLTYAVQSD